MAKHIFIEGVYKLATWQRKLVWTMFERSYFHEGFVRLNFALTLKILRLSRTRRSKTIECSFTFKRQNQPPEVFCKKKKILKISQNSQENTCATVSFLKKRLWGRRFPVNFEKFLRTHFLQNNSWQMLLTRTRHNNNIQLFLRVVL